MKKFLAVLGLMILPFGSYANDWAVDAIEDFSLVNAIVISPFDLINWKVGDTASYNVGAGSFGNVGTTVKSVTKDEGKALWVKQETALMSQRDVMEMLINKADAKILKFIHNGKEEPVPNDKLEIISQEYDTVTVPAGTFKCLHVVAKTQKVSKLEVWLNPKDTVMDGALKSVVATGLVDMTMELTSFKHGQ